MVPVSFSYLAPCVTCSCFPHFSRSLHEGLVLIYLSVKHSNVYVLYPGRHHLLLIGILVVICMQQPRTSRDRVKYKDADFPFWLFLCGSIWIFHQPIHTSHSLARIQVHPLHVTSYAVVRKSYCKSYWTLGHVLYRSSQKYDCVTCRLQKNTGWLTNLFFNIFTKKCMWIVTCVW